MGCNNSCSIKTDISINAKRRCVSRCLEKTSVVLIHKRDSKNLIKNYRPISLLPIFRKVFEGLIFNSLFSFFLQNKLFTECQSCFISSDLCVGQLLSITHEIYKSFDCNPPYGIRGLFLDIS